MGEIRKMASIVLSFVGNQDPYSDKNNQDGSIVSLVKYLLNQNQIIKRVILLYTDDTKAQAELTREYLNLDYQIELETLELISVSPELSQDPINVVLATQEARQGLTKAFNYQERNDLIEFNSSSGTPAMKTSWSILQASGLATKSRLWQVRNPSQMKDNQERVFLNNVNSFKEESDRRMLKIQLQNFNYQSALQILKNSNFDSDVVKSLLEYADYRLSFNFDHAFRAISKIKEQIDNCWEQQINRLRQKQTTAILQELYYKVMVELKNKQHANFLILLSCFQEKLLRYLVKQMLLSTNEINKNWNDLEKQQILSRKIKSFDGGGLIKYLEEYRLPRGERLKLDFDRFLNRKILQAIIEYKSEYSFLLAPIRELESYCEQRNDYIHNLEGVDEINEDESQKILKNMRKILHNISQFSPENPFNLLNEQLLNQLNYNA
jgi:hypothetical protein